MNGKTSKKNATKTSKATEPQVETMTPEPAITPTETETLSTPAEAKVTPQSKNGKTKKDPKVSAKPKAPSAKKLSALDAAARVLAASKEPLTCKELIEKMQAEGLWTTTTGQTPDATLNAALHREIKVKGDASRFAKAERGKFTLSATPK